MMSRRPAVRIVAPALVAVLLVVALAAPPVQADPFLLGSAMVSAASAIIMLGSYLFVANTQGSEPGAPPGAVSAMGACTRERDGSTICWPANQGDPAVSGPEPAEIAEVLPAPAPPSETP